MRRKNINKEKWLRNIQMTVNKEERNNNEGLKLGKFVLKKKIKDTEKSKNKL